MTAARISFAASAAFLALLAALHLLRPELDPSWRFISEYELGAHGWLMRLAFLSLALSRGALCVAVSRLQRSPEVDHPCSSEPDHARSEPRARARIGRAAWRTKQRAPEDEVLEGGVCALAGDDHAGGARSDGPSMRMVWHRWRRRLRSASTSALLPRKVCQSS